MEAEPCTVERPCPVQESSDTALHSEAPGLAAPGLPMPMREEHSRVGLARDLRKLFAELRAQRHERAYLIEVMGQTRNADRMVRAGLWHHAIQEYERVLHTLDSENAQARVLADAPRDESEASLEAQVDALRGSILARVRHRVQAVSSTWRAILRSLRWWLLALSVLILGSLLLAYRLREREIGAGAEWSWSSGGAVTRGVLAAHATLHNTGNYFFHTDCHVEPSLDIDLRAERVVSSVIAVNRLDCCQERARTLKISTSVDGKQFVEAAMHDSKEVFKEWTAKFSPRHARYVRLQLTEKTCLHLAEVRVLGR